MSEFVNMDKKEDDNKKLKIKRVDTDETVFAVGVKPEKPSNKKSRASSASTTVPSTSTATLDLSPTVPVPLSSISPTSDSKNHKAIYKIFPSNYQNNRDRYVGKEYIQLLKDPSFMDNFDDVDFYMNALFKNMANDLKRDKSEPRSILPYFQKVVNFDPMTYSKPKIGGKKSRKHRKTSNRRKTFKRNKKQKRRTYKKKK